MNTRLVRALPVLVIGLLAGSGCSGDDGATTATTVGVVDSVFQPAGAARTPFCAAMSDIALRVNTDPPDDLNTYLLDEYERLLPEVPAAIASEFQSVIDGLRGLPVATSPTTFTLAPTGTTIDPEAFPDEGYLPDPEPQLRLNSYLAANCFGTQSNPGPPATAPLSEVPDTVS